MRTTSSVVLLACALATPAAAADDLAAWVAEAGRRLEVASAANVPVLVPPVPVAVTWKPRRRASLELGAPLGGLVAADLDADGRAELYLVTDAHVIALDLGGAAAVERARWAFPVEPAPIRPRDLVVSWTVEPGALVVRTSTRARASRIGWQDGALVERDRVAGFPTCDGPQDLAPGRNHFGDEARPVFQVGCPRGLVDPAGRALRVRAELGARGALQVEAAVACAGPACTPPLPVPVAGIGVGFVVADVDRDGALEVVAAGAGAPGDLDAVKVIRLADAGAKRPWFRRAFTAGVVGIAVGDLDGDGDDDVLCATRLAGATRVELWQLNA